MNAQGDRWLEFASQDLQAISAARACWQKANID
jgi:hypothetical protein